MDPNDKPAPALLRDAMEVAHDILELLDPEYRRRGRDGDLGDHYVKCRGAAAFIVADRAARQPDVDRLRALL